MDPTSPETHLLVGTLNEQVHLRKKSFPLNPSPEWKMNSTLNCRREIKRIE
jgi:hypothetical protein